MFLIFLSFLCLQTDDMVDDALLDDEGWDLLNSLTEEELEQLNNDFDPEVSGWHKRCVRFLQTEDQEKSN